jgi:maltooligosyltrehalose trehalohydrolase
LDGGPPLPDPLSRWQPDGIDAPSAVYLTDRQTWDDGSWVGLDRHQLVFYELHVGTFTREGTFDAIVPRIEELLDLGITAIELMPIAQFAGQRGWGYDGVFPFAVQNSYSGPQGLNRLVTEFHRRGMAVFLDVVYNHFGPDGNVFPRFGDYLTDKYKTPWGAAVNYDGPGCEVVRGMVLDNVRMWVRDFHVDGLRLDATDQIFDRSPRHIVSEIAEVAHAAADHAGRRCFVFAETDQNDAPRYLRPVDRGGYEIDGQWNDDFHHAVHVTLTGETAGYYLDFADGPAALALSYERVFVNDGRYSQFRGRRHGTPAIEFAGDCFVACTQNHDQVGNRLKGDRLATFVSPAAARLAAGLLLLAPRLPLLFMGEEYGETNPFQFFCDFQSPELVEAVRKGRKEEFARFVWEDEPPDPFAISTRNQAVLSWSWRDPIRAGLRVLYRDLLTLRREAPALRNYAHAHVRLLNANAILEVERPGLKPEETLQIHFNLSDRECSLPDETLARLPAFRSEVPRYGAELRHASDPRRLQPHEFAIFGELAAP